MSTVTKPPVKVKLSQKDEACHRLVRLLMRAYYGLEHVAIVDCLLDLQVKQANKVTEADLSTALHLSPKMIREVLHRLRQDQLVKGLQKAEAAKTTEELTSRGKRKGYTRAPTVTFTWHIDFEQVVNVIKFRHWDIFEKLNKKVDKSEVFYICPTADCDNHAVARKRSVMDLLLEARSPDGVFRCELCFTHNPLLDTKQATQLILLTHAESSTNDRAASPTSGDLGIAPSETLKNKFNKQVGVILEQLTRVNAMLQEDIQNKKDAAAAGATAAFAAAESAANGGLIQFANPAALAASSAAAAASSGGGSTTDSTQTGFPQTNVEDMISVDLTGAGAPASASTDGGPSKRAKMESVISSRARDILPWDKKNTLSLAQVEEEKAAQEARRSAAQAEETRLAAEEEQRRFQAEYEQQLAKQQSAAAAVAAAAAMDDHSAYAQPDMMLEDDLGPRVSVSGRLVPLSSITQEDIDQMTPDEFEQYSSQYTETEEF